MSMRFSPAATMALLVLGLSLTGCTTPSDTAPAQPEKARVSIDSDSSGTTMTGSAQTAGPAEDGTTRRWRLVTTVDANQQVQRTLLVTIGYPGSPRGYTRATSAGGRSLPVRGLENAEDICNGACSVVESVAVSIDRATLHNAVNSGFSVKLLPQHGTPATITVDSQMAWAQVTAEDQSLPPTADAAPAPTRKHSKKKPASK